MTIRRRLSRTAAALAGGAALSLAGSALLATAASAHIDPEPAAGQAGSTITVQFKVEHGCEGSPTTKLEIKVPAGATDAAVVEKPGWTGAVAGGVVTYSGGSLGPETADTFGITVKLPATAGTLAFPIVQTCEQGSISWIEATTAGGSEPEHPAPVVTVTEAAPTSSEETGAGEHGHDETVSEGATTTAAPTTSAAPTTKDPLDDSGLDTIAGVGGGKAISNGNLILGGIVAAVVVAAGGYGFTVLRKRDATKEAALRAAAKDTTE